MKQLYALVGIIAGLILGTTFAANAATILFPSGGGTGTSTNPTYGQLLVGNASGTYTLTATSSLGISSSGGTGTVSTSTHETSGFLSYFTSNSATPALLGQVATTTLTFSSFPANLSATMGALVGGSSATWTWWGLATTSQPASSNLLVSNGGQGVFGVATSTLSASSPLTGSFTQIGSGGSLGCTTASSGVGGCLSNTAFDTFNLKQAPGFQISTTSSIGISKLAYFTGVSGTVLGGVATTSVSCSSGASCTSFTTIGASPITITAPGTFSWTPATNYGAAANSTSTPIWFTAGLQASTTANYFAGLTIDNALAGDALTQYGAANHEWVTGAKSSDFTFRISSSTTLGTSDALTIDKNLKVSIPGSLSIASLTGLALMTSGAVTAYGGATCTNQALTALSASGSATCSSVTDSFLSGAIGIAHGGTATTTATTNGVVYADGSKLTEDPAKLSFGGVFFGISSSTPNFSLSVGTGNSAFYVSTSTGKIVGYDSTNGWNGRISPTHSFVLGTGTTTTWTASTTGSAYSPFLVMPFAGTLRQVRCALDASFLGVNVQVNGSNATPSYFVASTTVGTVAFTAGNTFTAGQKILANFGTTTTATATQANCTFDITETP